MLFQRQGMLQTKNVENQFTVQFWFTTTEFNTSLPTTLNPLKFTSTCDMVGTGGWSASVATGTAIGKDVIKR
jgi:hypothetical protein